MIDVWMDGKVVQMPDEVLERVIPPPPDLYAHAAEARWRYEVGGIKMGLMTIATDDRSKTLIMGARMAADLDPAFTTAFKTSSGDFITVDAPTVILLSNMLLNHVAIAFAKEAQVTTAIKDGTITTTDEIDAAFGYKAPATSL